MIRVALTDSFHLHERNFRSLFQFLKIKNVSNTTLLKKGDDGFGLIAATGCYDTLEERVSPLVARSIRSQAEVYASYDADRLYATESQHIRLWSLCRSELLAYLLAFDSWHTEVMVKNDRAIFDKAYAENIDALTLNMAVATFWVNHWYDMRKDIFAQHFACVFSGSMIYTRALMALLRSSPTRPILMESTFTGNDYIFEEMYHPVANNLGVKHANLRTSRFDPEFEDPDQYDREVIKARNKVLSAKNKNVIQPNEVPLTQFPDTGARQVLIVGQVANDYSLIEDGFPYVGSIAVYCELIDKILSETGHNIIFKAHPWEHKKVNLRSAKTFDALAAHVAALPAADRARVLLVEDVNLYSLIDESDYFVTLCSQAAIEAALLGLRPFVLGQAFYSDAGFTVDCPDIDRLVAALGTEYGVLTLADYACLDRFLVDLFQCGTVSIYDSGIRKIARMFAPRTPLVQKTPVRTELQLGQTIVATPYTVEGWSHVLKKKEAMPQTKLAKEILEESLRIVPKDWPDSFPAGIQVRVPAVLLNTSDYVLPAQLMGKSFDLSYHIFAPDGIERVEWNGDKSTLSSDIPDEMAVTLQIKAPDTPGRYLLQPALVLPGEFWVDTKEMLEMNVA